jgi:hypothetical protein
MMVSPKRARAGQTVNTRRALGGKAAGESLDTEITGSVFLKQTELTRHRATRYRI